MVTPQNQDFSLSKYSNLYLKEAANLPEMFMYPNDSGKLCLKQGHSYYYEIQGQLHICSLRWCDLIVWTPKGVTITRIKHDVGLISPQCCQWQLVRVVNKSVLPLLRHTGVFISLEYYPGYKTREQHSKNTSDSFFHARTHAKYYLTSNVFKESIAEFGHFNPFYCSLSMNT